MQTGTIAQQVRSFIVENFLLGQDTGLKDGDSFLEGGIIDSTGVLELVTFLQEQFAITVEDEEVIPDNLDSITNLVTYVASKLNGKT